MKSDLMKIVRLFRSSPARALALAAILLAAAAVTGTVSNAVTERFIYEALHASVSQPSTGENGKPDRVTDRCRTWKPS
jgi:hypothetical protein